MRFLLRRRWLVLGLAAFLGCGGLIAANALTMQNARHPAPLFARAAPTAPPATMRQGAAAMPNPSQPAPGRIPQRQASDSQTVLPPVPERPAVATSAPVPPPRPVSETASVARDPIGDLIRAKSLPGSGSAAAAPSSGEADIRVSAAQEALSRLGYGPVTIDGRFGPQTRSAIERFEADQGLSVTGALNPETRRALAIRSGITIE